MKHYDVKECDCGFEHKVFTHRSCDVCGKTTKSSDWTPHNAEPSAYNYGETEVRYTFGKSYPDDCYGDFYDIDVCPECFMNTVLPALEAAAGHKFQPKDF